MAMDTYVNESRKALVELLGVYVDTDKEVADSEFMKDYFLTRSSELLKNLIDLNEEGGETTNDTPPNLFSVFLEAFHLIDSLIDLAVKVTEHCRDDHDCDIEPISRDKFMTTIGEVLAKH